MRLRKLSLGIAGIGLLTAMVTVVGAGSAQAVTTANGTITCKALAGTITFVPPIETTGDTNSAKAVVKVTLKTCTYTSTNIPGAHGTITGAAAATLTTTTTNNTANACSGLATSRAVSLKVPWKDSNGQALAATTVSYSGFDVVANGAFAGFDLPQDTGGTASELGSFAGTDGGATSQANAFVKSTTTQISTACNGATNDGLKTLGLGHAGTVADPSESIGA